MIIIKIIQTLFIKQIVTEKSKAQLAEKFYNEKLQLERECQQLLFEKKKLTNKQKISNQSLEKRFENEVNKRKEQIALIDFKSTQLDVLAIGEEIIENEVESICEINIGDNWYQKTKAKAIVIKDGIVVRIDE